MLISVKEIIQKSIDLYKDHYQLFFKYMGLLLIPTGIISVTSLFFGSFIQALLSYGLGVTFIIYLAIIIASSLLSLLISLSFIRVLANVYNKQANKAIKDELSFSIKFIMPAIVASILTTLAVIGGTILFIIPGIIFAIWFTFSIYGVALDEKSGIEAMHFSKSLVSGRWGEVLWRLIAPAFVFGMTIIFIQWLISLPIGIAFDNITAGSTLHIVLATIVSLLGVMIGLFITPLTTAAPTILYLELKKNPVTKNIDVPSEVK